MQGSCSSRMSLLPSTPAEYLGVILATYLSALPSNRGRSIFEEVRSTPGDPETVLNLVRKAMRLADGQHVEDLEELRRLHRKGELPDTPGEFASLILYLCLCHMGHERAEPIYKEIAENVLAPETILDFVRMTLALADRR